MQRELPLAGLRVLDLGWLTAGAATSTLLLDLGAEVIKLEGPSAIDPFRNWEGAKPGTGWWNESPMFSFTNRGKRSVCLDLQDPRSRPVMERLLPQVDIIVENFRRGVLTSLGLSPQVLRKQYPRIVVASISSQGEDGPERDMVSFGSTLEATGGLAAMTGPANGPPVVTGRELNYPDQVVSLFATGAILSAIMRRDATGQGVHLDISQRELTSFLLGEELMATAAGVASPRRGNGDAEDPEQDIVWAEERWHAVWAGGSAEVRDGTTLTAAADFWRSNAVMHSPAGQPVKGVPFSFSHRAFEIRGECRHLGADNYAVLSELGISAKEIESLECAGVLATQPRSKRSA